MARGGRLPRTAGRPPRFLRTGHRRATSLNEAHLQAAQRDARHTLGREAEGVLQSLLFHRASRGLRAQTATFRVLAEGDPDVDATLASAAGCPPPRSLTPPRPPLSAQRGRAARLPRCPDCPTAVALNGVESIHVAARLVAERQRRRRPARHTRTGSRARSRLLLRRLEPERRAHPAAELVAVPGRPTRQRRDRRARRSQCLAKQPRGLCTGWRPVPGAASEWAQLVAGGA